LIAWLFSASHFVSKLQEIKQVLFDSVVVILDVLPNCQRVRHNRNIAVPAQNLVGLHFMFTVEMALQQFVDR
jgi:hypothetical protein